MKRRLLTVMLCMVLLFSAFPAVTWAESDSTGTIEEKDEKIVESVQEGADFEPGIVIVTIKKEYSGLDKDFSSGDFPGVKIANIEYLTIMTTDQSNPLINYDEFRQILKLTLQEKSKQAVLDAIEILDKNDIVKTATPDYIISFDKPETPSVTEEAGSLPNYSEGTVTLPNDPLVNSQRALDIIKAPYAWNETTGSRNVKVGIIDSGIEEHEDLANNVVSGWDFVDDKAIRFGDTVGHGTGVASIVGAVGNNEIGLSGVAWNVQMVPLRISHDGSATLSDLADAIKYAQRENIPIVNISGGYTGFFGINVYNAISNYSGLLVCSAGNNSLNTDHYFHYPSSFTHGNIVSVANCTFDDQLSTSSNYGVGTVDLAAPGESIFMAVGKDMYHFWSGTSFAAPHVTGAGALLLSKYPELTSYQIRHAILSSVDQVPALKNKVATGGRLNIQNAFNCLSVVKKNYKVVLDYTNPSGSSCYDVTAEIGFDGEKLNLYNITADVNPGYVKPVTHGNDKIQKVEMPGYVTGSKSGTLATLRFDCPFNEDNYQPEFELDGYSSLNNKVQISMKSVMMGDIDMDHKVTTQDSILAMQYGTKIVTLNDQQLLAGDVNEDGVVNTDDGIRIQKYLVKLLSSFWQ